MLHVTCDLFLFFVTVFIVYTLLVCYSYKYTKNIQLLASTECFKGNKTHPNVLIYIYCNYNRKQYVLQLHIFNNFIVNVLLPLTKLKYGKRLFTMSTTSYRNVRKSKFTQISNDLLNDEQLTLESKALLSIFLSNSDNWNLHMSEIIKRSKNGRDAHYSALKN